MNPSTFTAFIGDDISQLFQITLNSLPVDLTTILGLTCQLQNNPQQASPTQTFAIGSGIVIANATQGTFSLVITAAQSALLAPQSGIDVDFVVTNSAGQQQTYRSWAVLSLLVRNC